MKKGKIVFSLALLLASIFIVMPRDAQAAYGTQKVRAIKCTANSVVYAYGNDCTGGTSICSENECPDSPSQ